MITDLRFIERDGVKILQMLGHNISINEGIGEVLDEGAYEWTDVPTEDLTNKG